ncbi:IS1096 element passenger TnpR family protein [Microbacterium thalassium]|uniref:Plasmid pRiA4b Orf3-like domain-containing protein n=1 Tax=Microbacterium thalassium TaxID=362649 RepID=A0A7X0KW07_9MICO|nr:hypothetical protein [Microbacterium thalassium]MBB6392733.1 hypothetical protein [Microbacterium thalassium]GLK23035.1 hypothetical protein GCM10017607_03530 [Microbacterium thalassium]
MPTAAVRHVIHLELTLADHDPAIVREVAIDQDLTLADLARVIPALFRGPLCERHVFASSPGSLRWSPLRRRWGDRRTLIDLRDPTLVDEATARIRSVLRSGEPLVFAHTCDPEFAVHIAPGRDDVVPAEHPAVRILRGERAAPLTCSRSPFHHEVLLAVLDDAEHPCSPALRASLAAAVGPWAAYDPEQFEPAAAQDAIASVMDEERMPSYAGPLEMLVASLPHDARAGLRTHIASAGLELPAVVTADEAAHLLRELTWVLTAATGPGVPLADGGIYSATADEGAERLDTDPRHVAALFQAARSLRFMYVRSGRIITKKAVCKALGDPSTLWNLLADAVLRAPICRDHHAQSLVLLAIADGSAADPAIGFSRAADAFAIIDDAHSRGWVGHFDDEWDGCDHRCDCPRIGGATWHDVVDAAIEHAARAATSDGSMTLAERNVDHRELAGPLGWRSERRMTTAAPSSADLETASGRNEPVFLREASDLIQLLSIFGLARDVNGAWSVPPTLRQLARTALQGRRQERRASRATHHFF